MRTQAFAVHAQTETVWRANRQSTDAMRRKAVDSPCVRGAWTLFRKAFSRLLASLDFTWTFADGIACHVGTARTGPVSNGALL